MTRTKPSTSPRPGVAAVVVGWNNRTLLDDCLASVYKQDYPDMRIIYVDNGSSDGSVAHIHRHHRTVTVIDTGANNGFAIANNLGIQEALKDRRCGAVVALNTDARLSPTWTSRLLSFIGDHPDTAGVQGLTLNDQNRQLVDSAGIYIDMSAAPLQIGYNQPRAEWPSGPVFGVNAAAALYTRRFLEQQPFGDDYFDSDLFMYYEDVDISARALAMGLKNYFCGEAIAYHMGSASSGGNPTFMLKMVHRNLPLVMAKNLPASTILKCLPGWWWAEASRFTQFVRQRRFGLATAMVVGRLKGLVLIPKFLGKRRVLRRGHHIPAADFEKLMRPQR